MANVEWFFYNGSMLTIREARIDDSDFIAQSQVSMAWETEEMKLDPPTVKLGVAAVFQDPSKGKYFIAVEENQGRETRIGCVLTISEWSDWRNGTVLWIHSLFVIPTERGKGVYRQMYEFLQNRVQTSNDLRGLRLYVDHRNVSAQKIYQKLGMSKEHYSMFEWMK